MINSESSIGKISNISFTFSSSVIVATFAASDCARSTKSIVVSVGVFLRLRILVLIDEAVFLTGILGETDQYNQERLCLLHHIYCKLRPHGQANGVRCRHQTA
ncbi:uncharacterized protein LOC117649929 [Thrips palmi]|uniref:Uncharacterized protein LOC117649929 n=1 Tax=Thrips palmi TaxID=161013 RepID=A0A6P8ZV71_THRPL|nr:uncharacterized protein LOC117649929 [Thrips palmi]